MPARYFDEHRRKIGELLEDAGVTPRALSLRLRLNSAYLTQYLKRGTPQHLPEKVRVALARELGKPEAELQEPGLRAAIGGGDLAKRGSVTKVGSATNPRGVAYTRLQLEEGRRNLPVLGVAGGASDALFLDPGDIRDMTARPRSLDAVEDAYGVYHAGVSMEPRYYAGEILHVNPTIPPRSGDFVVIQFADHTALVKQFVRRTETELIAHQFNPDKEVAFPLGEITAVHVIVGTARQ